MEHKLLYNRYQPNKWIYVVLPVLLLSILSWFNPQTVYANGPKPADNLMLSVVNYSDQAAYVDLLIKMDQSNEHYTAFNESIGKTYGISKESEIVTYEKDGYLSYTFHFSNAGSDIALEKDKINIFAGSYDDFNYIYDESRYFRVAILDSHGEIIAMSKECRLKGMADTYLKPCVITYDVSQNQVEGIENYQNIIDTFPILFLYFLLTWVTPLIITIAVEGDVAKLYKFDSIKRINHMNIVTNLSLSFYITLVQQHSINYVYAVISGEILVYIIEFIWLTKIYHEKFSVKRIAQYTVVANTASLILTVLINKVGKYVVEHLI